MASNTHAHALCQCHDKPVADGATLCADGTAELGDLLRWLTADISRADREPTLETITTRTKSNGDDVYTQRTVITRGSYASLPSTIWDTPSGEMRNLPRILTESAARLAIRTTHARLNLHQTEPPIPVNLRAVDDAGRLRELIGRYATILSGRRVPLDAAWDVGTVAAWLIDETQTIRQQDWAGTLLDELRRLIGRVTRSIDVAPTRHYLGICRAGAIPEPTPGSPQNAPDAPEPTPRCQGQVFALDGALTGRCNTCRAQHSVAERNEQRSRDLIGIRMTAVEIERLTTEIGRRIPRTTIRRWAESGRLDDDGSDTPRYLYDEACKLAAEADVTRQRRAELKAEREPRQIPA